MRHDCDDGGARHFMSSMGSPRSPRLAFDSVDILVGKGHEPDQRPTRGSESDWMTI